MERFFFWRETNLSRGDHWPGWRSFKMPELPQPKKPKTQLVFYIITGSNVLWRLRALCPPSWKPSEKSWDFSSEAAPPPFFGNLLSSLPPPVSCCYCCLGRLTLLLLLSRLMLLRPAAADAQLLLTHWCQLKQLEQSEAKTQKSHSLGLTLLDRFFRISGPVSNSRTTIATSWQIFSCSRHRHRLGICSRPCRILHICRSIQFKFKILIFKECYNFNPIPIWSFRKRTQLNNEKVKFPCFHCSVCFPPIVVGFQLTCATKAEGFAKKIALTTPFPMKERNKELLHNVESTCQNLTIWSLL